jgi:hypothetical protein
MDANSGMNRPSVALCPSKARASLEERYAASRVISDSPTDAAITTVAMVADLIAPLIDSSPRQVLGEANAKQVVSGHIPVTPNPPWRA